MNDILSRLRYCAWRLELYDRNYGSYQQIDEDVACGRLIPGTIPTGFERPGARWVGQAEIQTRWRRRANHPE